MHELDFLPAGYRESNARRFHRVWHSILASLLAACCAAATAFQLWQAHEIRQEIADIQTAYDDTAAIATRLEQARARLEVERVEARLITYLAHPWPKSQVLDAVIRPLNEAITLDEIRVFREPLVAGGAQPRKGPAPVAAALAPTPAARGTAVDRDLAQLQADFDTTRLVVHLSGVTHEGIDLYQYIAALAQNPLVEKAEVTSLESNNKHDAPGIKSLNKFQARVSIRPGHGQPNGPRPRHVGGWESERVRAIIAGVVTLSLSHALTL